MRSVTRIKPTRSEFWTADVASSAAACAARSALVFPSGPNRRLAETSTISQRQRPLLDEPADVGLPLPRGDVPVEVPDVVPRLVRAQFGERQPQPRTRPVVRP